MIYYRPTDGDVYPAPFKWRAKTCFLMTRLGNPIPPVVTEIRQVVKQILLEKKIEIVDANSITTGKDFLLKIWELALSVPIGIAIIYKGIPYQTMANIFYELGWMQSFGKETLIIKFGSIKIPSDFVRTEYVTYDRDFIRKFNDFIESLSSRAEYYETISELVEKNPLLAIDYLKRAYLLTGNENLRNKANNIYKTAGLNNRSKNSVERLHISF